MKSDNASDAFSQLKEEDRRSLIDSLVAALIIGVRIPDTGQDLYDLVATAFAKSRGLSANVVKYAVKAVGESLIEQGWTFAVTKDRDGITTAFKMPEEDLDGVDHS